MQMTNTEYVCVKADHLKTKHTGFGELTVSLKIAQKRQKYA